MKRLLTAVLAIVFVLTLGVCAASTTPPVGVSCDYGQGKPMWEMPLDCQGR